MNDLRFKIYYQSNENFEICNPNPRWKEKKGFVWDTGDCVIRALANSTNSTWVEAFDYLAIRARRDYAILNDHEWVRKWLTQDGVEWHYCKPEKGKKRMTALEFAKAHPNGRYYLEVASHATAVVNGKILDAWNCGGKCVVGYFDMTEWKIK